MSILIKCLESSIDTHLIKDFQERGFEKIEVAASARNTELGRAFRLGCLKRLRGDKLDIVEFQFDKNNRPRFVVNFGVAYREGVTLPSGQFVKQEDMDVSCIKDAYRLFMCPRTDTWFRPPFLTWRKDTSIEKVVLKASQASSEIHRWFDGGLVGKHMKKMINY